MEEALDVVIEMVRKGEISGETSWEAAPMDTSDSNLEQDAETSPIVNYVPKFPPPGLVPTPNPLSTEKNEVRVTPEDAVLVREMANRSVTVHLEKLMSPEPVVTTGERPLDANPDESDAELLKTLHASLDEEMDEDDRLIVVDDVDASTSDARQESAASGSDERTGAWRLLLSADERKKRAKAATKQSTRRKRSVSLRRRQGPSKRSRNDTSTDSDMLSPV